MRQAAEEGTRIPGTLQELYAPIARQLQQIEQIFCQELRSRHPFIDRLAQHGFRLGGKRLRPALLLLSASACGRIEQTHLILATAMEMFHTATLIHDDVLDEAMMRRHLVTVNAQWDNETSVLLGDYLFTRSLCMISSLDDAFACRTFARASRVMCEGELRQAASRGNYGLTEPEYLEIIADKTGALTACCCRLGAHYAGGDPAQCEALERFGLELGVAFQIADDLLDVLGDESKVGKSLGTDLLKQKSTLPMIRLLAQVPLPERRELLALLSRSDNHRREALRPWWDGSDALAYTRQKAYWHARQAAEALAVLPPGPAREALRGLTDFVVSRDQ
ncbi:MAG: polyprenyl synthetase family protein [Thermoguttaceae bacterium]|jgi:octaprenyl-diphosphate synthase